MSTKKRDSQVLNNLDDPTNLSGKQPEIRKRPPPKYLTTIRPHEARHLAASVLGGERSLCETTRSMGTWMRH